MTHIVTRKTKGEIIEHAEQSNKTIYQWDSKILSFVMFYSNLTVELVTFIDKKYKEMEYGALPPLLSPPARKKLRSAQSAISASEIPYIKLITPNHRSPQVKRFIPDEKGRPTVPSINYNSPAGCSPFLPEEECERVQEFLQKVSTNGVTGKRKTFIANVPDKPGYCENCSERFESYKEVNFANTCIDAV